MRSIHQVRIDRQGHLVRLGKFVSSPQTLALLYTEVRMFLNSIETEIQGYDFQLLSEGGLYWDRESTLFVADAHLGKEATFESMDFLSRW